MASSRIHKRGLTSFFTLFGFLIMAITGLVLYVVPAGRIAYWVTWELFGLTKTDWGNIHILSSILFIVAGGFHTYFNWKPLMNYFKEKARKGVKLRRELTITSVVSAWVIISAIFPFPPLSYLLDLNEWVKESWIIQDEYEPPFGHAELLSLRVFAKKMEIDIDRAVEELKDNGISFKSTENILEDIAVSNDVSPMDIYSLIKKFEPAPEPEKLDEYTPESVEIEFSGTGIGNKTIGSICERYGLDTTVAIRRLASAGLFVDSDQKMKAVAEIAETESIEIMKLILIDGYTLPPDDQ